MSHGKDHESDAFVWKHISDKFSKDFEGGKVILISEPNEEKEKKWGRDSATNNKGKGAEEEKEEGRVEFSKHDIYTWTEKDRRNKMKNLFSELHSLLPQTAAKADRSSIVYDGINYIKRLELEIQRIQNLKLKMLQGGPTKSFPFQPSVAATSKVAMLSTREEFMADQISNMNNNSTTIKSSASNSHLPVVIQTWTSSNVVINIIGNDVQYAIYAPKRPEFFTTICDILQKYKVEVTLATVSSDVDRSLYIIQASATTGAIDLFPSDSFTVEELYKQAAGAIITYLSF